MVMVRMGSAQILSIKQSASIYTMINFDGDDDGHGDGTCKLTLTVWYCRDATVGERGAAADHLGEPRGR